MLFNCLPPSPSVFSPHGDMGTSQAAAEGPKPELSAPPGSSRTLPLGATAMGTRWPRGHGVLSGGVGTWRRMLHPPHHLREEGRGAGGGDICPHPPCSQELFVARIGLDEASPSWWGVTLSPSPHPSPSSHHGPELVASAPRKT